MSQKSPPTYSPPAPPTLQTGGQLYSGAQDWYNQNGYGGLLNAQSTALQNANNPNYYASFQPTSLENALGNQYFKNIWPNEQAQIANQFAMSGMANSPALASTQANAYGNLATGVGQYLANQGDQRATNSINAGLGINPMSFLNPLAATEGNQSNSQAQLQYGYQQAQAQQAYQQQMNKYQQQQSMARMIGQISPIGGPIYGASTGTFGSTTAGLMDDVNMIAPMAMSAATGMPSGGMGMSSGGGMNGGNNIPQFASGGYGGMPSGSSVANGTSSVY